jgi:predicted Zn-dependent protease
MVLLSLGRVDEAIGLLEANVFDPTAPGISYLHLAIAYEKKGWQPAAEATAKIAKARGASDLRAQDADAMRRLTP